MLDSLRCPHCLSEQIAEYSLPNKNLYIGIN